MDQSLVTVYVTNYNYGRYLQQAVDSLLAQTLQDFELLVIDDGSTDDSRAVLARLEDHPRIEVIYQQNRGLNVTNNIALRLARGKYIVRLDADDYFEPDALESMVALLEADDSIGLVFPDYYVVDQAGEVLEVIHRLDFGKDVTLRDQPAHGACTMIRTDYLREVGGYNESYRCQDGYELWIKFATRFGVANINRPLFHYRQHGENLTGNEQRILDTRMRIKKDYLEAQRVVAPKTVAIVPLRRSAFRGEHLAQLKLGRKSLLRRKLESLQRVQSISQVFVTSADDNLRLFAKTEIVGLDKPTVVSRSASSERLNSSLFSTVQEVLLNGGVQTDCLLVMTVAVEYPFVDEISLQDAINTLQVFEADSLISVRPDASSFYQHHGAGMVPILDQAKTTKLEREALYRSAGGIILSRIKGCLAERRLLHGKVGHVVLSREAAHGIESNLDFDIAQMIDSRISAHRTECGSASVAGI